MAKIKKHIHIFLFFIAVIFVLVVSISTLTTKPKIWADEAKSIELARSFLNYGVLDIEIAPSKFSSQAPFLQSTGYPVTIILALFFKIFGYGFIQARIFMLIWMVAGLYVIFWFCRKLFGAREALFAVFLVATFASFHDNARTVVGEIPGFIFLLLGLNEWLFKKSYFKSGIWLGFAIITKPSVYLSLIPSIFFIWLFKYKKEFFTNGIKASIGAVFPAILWFFVVPGSVSYVTGSSLFNFLNNPYETSSIFDNITRNLLSIPYSTTLIYFGMLLVIILLARRLIFEEKQKDFLHFSLLFIVFAFLYYLRSPGWLRYIIAGELLILMLFPNMLIVLFHKRRNIAFAVLCGLIAMQTVQFFTVAQIYYSNSAINVARFVNETFPNRSVAVLNDMTISVLLSSKTRYQIIHMTGIPILGANPLFLDDLASVIVSHPENIFLNDGLNVLHSRYALAEQIDGYNIYTLR